MTARGLIFAGYFTLVGYTLAKTGAVGKAAAGLRALRDDMIRHDLLVANDMALAIEQLRAQHRADVSRETSASFRSQAGEFPAGDVSRETSET